MLIVGAGPCGLRTAVETQLLGANTILIERRNAFTRNNVLKLWKFLIEDLKSLGKESENNNRLFRCTVRSFERENQFCKLGTCNFCGFINLRLWLRCYCMWVGCENDTLRSHLHLIVLNNHRN